jgi:DnaJ-class molecular chaperone
MQTKPLPHPDDACRTCRGTGWQTYPSGDLYGDRRTLTEPCMTCGGTGVK